MSTNRPKRRAVTHRDKRIGEKKRKGTTVFVATKKKRRPEFAYVKKRKRALRRGEA